MTQQRGKKILEKDHIPLLLDSDKPMLSKLCFPCLLQGVHYEGSTLASGVSLRKSQALGKGKRAMNLWSFKTKS